MTEAFLHYVWRYKLCGNIFKGVKGETIEVIHPGEWNTDAGPDFFNARIRINGLEMAGNIEIHVCSTDFYRHGHQFNNAYDHLALHVVAYHNMADSIENVTVLELRKYLPEQALKNYALLMKERSVIACGPLLSTVPDIIWKSWLHRLSVERLEEKMDYMQSLFRYTKNNYEETLYIALCRAFGFHINGLPFEMLAKSLPYSLIKKNRDSELAVHALVFGQAGLLEETYEEPYVRSLQNEYTHLRHKYGLQPLRKKIWKYMRARPGNFPTLRLAQLATFLKETDQLFDLMLGLKRIDHLLIAFQKELPGFWNSHYRLESRSTKSSRLMGSRSVYSIAVNTLAPFLFFYGQQSGQEEYKEKAIYWLETIPGERNTKVSSFLSIRSGLHSALESQAMIRLYDEFCSIRACLSCSVGGFLIKK